jgi:chorismate synthase
MEGVQTELKEVTHMSVTDSFAKLKTEIDKAESAIKAAAKEDEADIEAKIDDARRQADGHAAELRSKSGGAATDAGSHWQEMRADWDRHIAHARQRMDAAKAAVDRDEAVQDATQAYADAMDAIDFAGSAISEAETATLEALRAEKNARRLGADL